MAVLLIFAVLAALAVRMSSNHSLLIAQARHQFGSDLALSYAVGAEELAREALRDDHQNTGKDVDHLQETWAQAIPPFELDEGGALEVQVVDLGGCFNLNGVAADQNAYKAFQQLLNNAGLPQRIADLVRDWTDVDQQINEGFGAEDSEYLLAQPAYRAANQPMRDLSEVDLLHDLQPEERRELKRLTCVRPDTGFQVNVNTAPPEVLAALVPNTSLGDLAPLAEGERSYLTVDEFIQENEDFVPAQAFLKTESQFFRINVHVNVADAVTIVSSLAERAADNGVVTILQRDFGREFTSRLALAASTTEAE